MPVLEKRAWITVWAMCPAYLVYFVIVAAYPQLTPTPLSKFGLLAVIACIHAAGYIGGELVVRRQHRGESLDGDERDHAIDARATRAAYFMLLTGMILCGMVMPFTDSGWKVANAALFFIVLSETLRVVLTLRAYHPRAAH
ncbi:MAG: hypothetical protein ACTHKZ_03290 [Lysobacteraceae bacterium]